jgi:hypothetical protein
LHSVGFCDIIILIKYANNTANKNFALQKCGKDEKYAKKTGH